MRLFTAAQAAQKINHKYGRGTLKFTAAQAAQKIQPVLIRLPPLFTAAQVAQKALSLLQVFWSTKVGHDLRKYCPELAAIEDKSIHDPYQKNQHYLDYAKPLVDLKQTRAYAIDAFKKL